MPTGSTSLPIGVIGIAIGTVLLPEMSRRLTADDQAGAMASQRRAFDFTLLFSVPFVAAFLTVPDVIMRAMFARGAFSKADAAAAGATLAAYAIGLIPFVLIRSAVATFYARKDTATPVKAALTGIAVNVALKIALVGSLAQVGLALATAVGAWINLLLVIGFAVRAGYLELDRALMQSLAKFAGRGVVLAAALWSAALVRESATRALERVARRSRAAAADRHRRGGLCRLDPAAVWPPVAGIAGSVDLNFIDISIDIRSEFRGCRSRWRFFATSASKMQRAMQLADPHSRESRVRIRSEFDLILRRGAPMRASTFKAIATAAFAAMAASSVASAADMAPRYTKAPPPIVEVWTWDKFYIGGNVGYSWGRSDTSGTFYNNVNGLQVSPHPERQHQSRRICGWRPGRQELAVRKLGRGLRTRWSMDRREGRSRLYLRCTGASADL